MHCLTVNNHGKFWVVLTFESVEEILLCKFKWKLLSSGFLHRGSKFPVWKKLDIVLLQMKPLGAITHEIDCFIILPKNGTFLHNNILIGSALAKSLLNKSEQNLSLKVFAIVVINNYFLLKRIIYE